MPACRSRARMTVQTTRDYFTILRTGAWPSDLTADEARVHLHAAFPRPAGGKCRSSEVAGRPSWNPPERQERIALNAPGGVKFAQPQQRPPREPAIQTFIGVSDSTARAFSSLTRGVCLT